MPHIRRLHIMKEVGRLWNQISENDLEKYKSLSSIEVFPFFISV